MYETKEDNSTEKDNSTEEDNSTGEDLNPRFHPSPVPQFIFTSPPDIWQWTAVANYDFSQQANPQFHFSNGSVLGSYPVGSAFRSFPVRSPFGSSPVRSPFGSSQVVSAFGSQQPQLVFPSTSTISETKHSDPEVPVVEMIQQNLPIEGNEEESLEPLPNAIVNVPEVPQVEEIQQKPAIEDNEVVNGPKVQNPAIEGNEVVNDPAVAVVEEIRQNPPIEGNEVVNGPEVAVVEEIEVVNNPDCAFCERPILPNEERLQCSEGMRGANHLKVIQVPCGNYLHVTCLNQHLRSFPDPANRKQRLLPKCPNCNGDITKRCPFCRKKLKRPVYQCRRDINGRRCPALYCNIACFFRSRHRRTAH